MSDDARFRPIKGLPENAHRNYHGAPLVDLVLSAVDRRIARGAEAAGSGFSIGSCVIGAVAMLIVMALAQGTTTEAGQRDRVPAAPIVSTR